MKYIYKAIFQEVPNYCCDFALLLTIQVIKSLHHLRNTLLISNADSRLMASSISIMKCHFKCQCKILSHSELPLQLALRNDGSHILPRQISEDIY